MQKSQAEDPDQSWISTQRTLGLPLQKFFKWLAYPDLTPQERKTLPKEMLPEVLKGFILHTKKGSKSPIRAKHIWDDSDIGIFLKYCTENPRLRFYHARAYETSARPRELLELKIGDIKIEQDSNTGKMYSALDIGRQGKKRQSRIVGITDFSIQYLQTYLLQHHPDPANKDSYLFLSKEHSAFSRNLPIGNNALRFDYHIFKDFVIPKLLKREDIPQADKEHLERIRKEKRWTPYTLRHSSITKLARSPYVNDYTGASRRNVRCSYVPIIANVMKRIPFDVIDTIADSDRNVRFFTITNNFYGAVRNLNEHDRYQRLESMFVISSILDSLWDFSTCFIFRYVSATPNAVNP